MRYLQPFVVAGSDEGLCLANWRNRGQLKTPHLACEEEFPGSWQRLSLPTRSCEAWRLVVHLNLAQPLERPNPVQGATCQQSDSATEVGATGAPRRWRVDRARLGTASVPRQSTPMPERSGTALGSEVRLDTTVDRQRLRAQCARLGELGYELDLKLQLWKRQPQP